MKPVPYSLTDDEIKEELRISFPVEKVTRIYNHNRQPTPSCSIILANTTQGKEIFNLQRFYHCVISVEPRRHSRQIPQCSNCLRYNHTRNYCHLEPRCARCAGPHNTHTCSTLTQSTAASFKPKCSNCGKDHVASYRGCEVHIKLKERLKLQQKSNEGHLSTQQPNRSSHQYRPAPVPVTNAWDTPLLNFGNINLENIIQAIIPKLTDI